ncbi:MAG: hydroxypyruvate isomerase [Dehalococcoidales bacterium]|jgi:hydroxypyruvate isomerase|nr:hydroxypyruvate isomerase [Dehalococcoidales bacterium]MDP7285986.1 hydroxypyruvate isomerase [Dehalococcoidales bacterium]MDP7415688.1 hydroxypyruvate isomerase [Dehalococcoidales bacterium]
MVSLSANLSMLFYEVNFLDRFAQASRAGFRGVECQFPYQWEKEALAERLNKYGLELVLHNMPPGNLSAGERGLACLPGREGEFQESVGLAVEYARFLECRRLNCMAGIPAAAVPAEKTRRTLVDNLRFAAAALEKEGISLLVEALNRYDAPGFYLNNSPDTLRLIDEVNRANLWFQYDIYHMQIMEGNLMKTVRENLTRIAHIQLADNPGRHEPGTGEINFPNLLRFIDEAGYNGWVGCEYRPAGATEEGLKWAKPYLRKGGE